MFKNSIIQERERNRGKAQTVLGPISTNDLGVTLPHEHIVIDVTSYFKEADDPAEKELSYQPISLWNLGWIRRNWYHNLDNLRCTDETIILSELLRYKLAGGKTIVDNTPWGYGRDPEALARLSKISGLNIIMGTGYYIQDPDPQKSLSFNEEDIASSIIRDLTVGVDNTGIKSGIIGEIGVSWPINDTELRSLHGAISAQQATGAPLMLHPGRNPQSPFQIIEILEKMEVDLSQIVIAHMDRTIFDLEGLTSLASKGCYLEFDMFGEGSCFFLPDPKVNLPSDAVRIDLVQGLVDEGYLNQILVSHDICSKIQLVRYGGEGYAHILKNIIPKMKLRDFTQAQIDTILIDNPRRWLAFK